MNLLRTALLLLPLLFTANLNAFAQETSVPRIGAQVFIEPGQDEASIDHWFKTLSENHMDVCRIRLFERHIHQNGTWDFSRYDIAMDKAEKYGIRVFLTLFPATPKSDIGGFKFPESQTHMESISTYIRKSVKQYKDHPALYCWVLQNEPGAGGLPGNALTNQKFREWKAGLPQESYESYGYWQQHFYRKRYLRQHENWFLDWLGQQVRRHDQTHPTHLNPHQIFNLLPEYDFMHWRRSLGSLGASMHPSWHFGYFKRRHYALAVAANSTLIRSAARELPWWVTELQGGNNIFSAFNPMLPSPDEFTQWLWTSIGSGTEGIIFWSLNPRATGREAGEWALLDFQDQPTPRMKTAAAIAKTVKQHAGFFENAQPVTSNITLLYTPESFYIEDASSMESPMAKGNYAGRQNGAVIKSLLAFYKSLTENGIPADIREMRDFNWTQAENQVLILPHTLSIPHEYWPKLKSFVKSGGKLIMTGLSGFYDEYKHGVMHTGKPLKDLLGANFKEVRFKRNLFPLTFNAHKLPAHLWKGTIHTEEATPFCRDSSNNVLGVRHAYGGGSVTWLPSPVGLGAWLDGTSGLGNWMRDELAAALNDLPLSLKAHREEIVFRAMQSGNAYLTVLVNTGTSRRTIPLAVPENLSGKKLFGQGRLQDHTVTLNPGKTLVVKWSK